MDALWSNLDIIHANEYLNDRALFKLQIKPKKVVEIDVLSLSQAIRGGRSVGGAVLSSRGARELILALPALA